MDHTAALVSLATSVPPHQFHQKQILEAARSILAHRYRQFETLASLFVNTGIRHRYGVKPIEWYLEPRGWPERTTHFWMERKRFSSLSRKTRSRVPASRPTTST